jgi:hypothetical protein
VAGDEPVTSPDQHRPTVGRRAARVGAVVVALMLLSLTFGNHIGNVENLFLVGLAALIFVVLVADVILRRGGLKSD